MSILINILENGEGVEILIFGAVHGREIIQARKDIYHAKHIMTRFKYHIINKSQCTEYNVTANDIASIAELDIQASMNNPGFIMAIIESEYLHFNLTEAWLAYVEEHISKIKSFKNRRTALEWINLSLL